MAGELIMNTINTKSDKGSPLYILGSYLRNGFSNSSASNLMELTNLPNWSLANPEDETILKELANQYFDYTDEKIGFRTLRPFKSLPNFVELPPNIWNETQAAKRRIVENRNQILPKPIVTEISENNPQNP